MDLDAAPPTTVVAVHGNGGGAFRFRPAAPHVPAPVRMLAPDLPGFGGRPLDDPDPTLATFTDALRAEVERARAAGERDDHRVVVLGHGIGGAVALDLLAREPDLADGLVLHAPVGTRLDTRWFPRLMASPTVREAARRAIASEALRPVWRWTIARTMPTATADAFLEGYDDCPAFGVMFDLLTADWFASLPVLDLPAVLLWGSDDRVLGADQRADYHALLPDAVEVVVDGWGHFPMLADPAGYAWRMAAVVAGVAARADTRDHGRARRVVPVGSGQLEALAVPGKAARLEALPDALVPRAVVVPDGLDADTAADEAKSWLAASDRVQRRFDEGAHAREATASTDRVQTSAHANAEAREPTSPTDRVQASTHATADAREASAPFDRVHPRAHDSADAREPTASTDRVQASAHAREPAAPPGVRRSGRGERVAVRSAFGVEDGEARSFAGAFATELDVVLDELAAAIARVRASGDGVDGVDATALRRDVLVMRMVDAVHAGVAFSEPGFVDDLVEHVDGLADGLVGGAVEGRRRELPRRELGEAVDDGWSARLQDALADLRAAVGDEPWDVEWADDGERTWLVQARPVTAPVQRDAELTLANHREILPDLPSRFMTSLVVDAGDDVFAYWQGFDDDVPRGRAFTEEVALRPWINLSLLVDTMRVLGLPASFVTDTMGGASDHDAPLRPTRVLRKAPTLLRMGVDQLGAVGSAEDAVRDLRALAAARPDDGGATAAVALARAAYVRLLLGMFPLSTAVSGPLAVLSALDVSAELHRRQRTAGTRVLDDLDAVRAAARDDADLVALVEHLHGHADAEPSAPLRTAWRRWLDAHGHRGVYESDLARPRYHEDPGPLLPLLDPRTSAAAAKRPEPRPAPVGHVGHRAGGTSTGERTDGDDRAPVDARDDAPIPAVGAPPLGVDRAPDDVDTTLSDHVPGTDVQDRGRAHTDDRDADTDAQDRGEAHARDRNADTQVVEDGTEGRVRDRVLGVLAAPVWVQATRAMQARERLRAEAMRTFDVVRRRLLAVAARAAEHGQLPEVEAIWDLTVDEVRALDDGASYDADFLAARRSELEAAAGLRLPDLLRRSDDPAEVGRADATEGPPEGRLRGRGLTRGTVAGTAVVLDEPGPVDGVPRPRVLVARGVDAGWVSVFAQVDAVVVETGGELSHGSIILRELGVPAVTNVRGATAAVASGDRVRVDARAGVVDRLDRGSADGPA